MVSESTGQNKISLSRANGETTKKVKVNSENKTVTVSGQRLQVTCRALSITYKESGEWVKTSRNYPAKWCVDGVIVGEADAVTLQAHLDAKRAKEQAKRAKATHAYERRTAAEAKASEEVTALRGECPARVSDGDNTGRTAWQQAKYEATERFLMLDAEYAAEKAKDQKKRESAAKREAKELAAIAASVNKRWTLEATDVKAFSEHANEPGEGRVVRTRTACKEDFDTKVYMALVAWVRHTKTNYEAEFSAAKEAAYAKYQDEKSYGEFGSDEYKTESLLEEFRREKQEARNELHAQYTAEAVAWLDSKTPQGANPAASVNSSDESASTSCEVAKPMAEAGCSVPLGNGQENILPVNFQPQFCTSCAKVWDNCECKVSASYFRA